MIYPTEPDIREYMARLPHELVTESKPSIEEAQREYRRARLRNPNDEKKLIEILFQHAASIFKTLVAKRLRSRSGDADAFQRAIGIEGGDAETAMWFAHDLYRMSGDGRMLRIWHREIESRLWSLVRQAEDIWWLPELVPEGWERFLDDHSRPPSPSPIRPPHQETTGHGGARVKERDQTALARARRAFVRPILDQKGWSVSQWAVEASVDFHTANDYLEGKTNPRASTRRDLATALGVSVDQLPR